MRNRVDITTTRQRVLRSLRRVGYICLSVCGSAFAQTTIDLDAGEEDVRVLGEDGSGFLGFSVAGGDVNGDGIDDLIMGVYGASPPGRAGAGITYIVYGDSNPLPTPMDLAGGVADMVILGAASSDQSGRSVAAGDVNGDGFEDIIVGAHSSDDGAVLDAGKVYVIYGSATLPNTLDLLSQPTELTLVGSAASDFLGGAVATGDINGDGFADIIAGARKADAPASRFDAGKVYVIYGDPTIITPATLSMSVQADKNIEIIGAVLNDNLGNAVAAGDIDGDAADDVIVAAYWADPNGSLSGEAYVLYGDPAATPSSYQQFDLITKPAPGVGVHIQGAAILDKAGEAVAAGDVNGDGFDDVIIGTTGADPGGLSNAGEVYVLYGGTLSTTENLPGAADVRIQGEAASHNLGWSMAALNSNGDGFDDLLLGAYPADTPGGTGAGKSYLIAGDPQLASQISLASTQADVTILGDDAGDFLGYAVAGGDLNGDFIEDLMPGAPTADTGAGLDAGEVYVIYGEAPYVELSLPVINATYNENLVIPVTVDTTNGLKMAEVDLHIAFDSDLLSWNSILDAGTLINAWTVNGAVSPGNASTIDTLKISASTNGAASTVKGVLLNIDFTVLDVRTPASSILEGAHVHFNGGRPEWVLFANGSVLLVGNDGSLATTVVSTPGDTVRVRAIDPDLNVNPAAIEVVTVEVVNSVTNELETVNLTEQTADDSIFFGTVTTVFGTVAGMDNDGEFNTQDGDNLFTSFEDLLNSAGVSLNLTATNFVIDPLGDASGNGTTKAFDAALILAHSVGNITLADHDSMAANVDLLAPFGPITAFDASLVIRQRVGLIGRFPIQEDESDNHPQPETDQSVPKVAVEGRELALRPGDGYISIWLEQRDNILSGDLRVEGVDETGVSLGPDVANALLDSRHDGDRLRIAFALERPVEGPGELLRIALPASSTISAASLISALRVHGHLNDATIKVAGGGNLQSQQSPAPVPSVFNLHSNFPNPFNGETTIRFDLPEAALVDLVLVNTLGQHVRSLAARELEAGFHANVWDGRDDDGNNVASGTYIYVLRAGRSVQSRRLLMIK